LPVAAGVVVAVNVTAEVTRAGLADEVSVNTVVALLTPCETAALVAGLYELSPE
jgi:hypothetical protein